MIQTQKITKTMLLRQLLEKDGGATLAAICAATGWQAHSARAALTGLPKGGTTVERVASPDGQPTRWRIGPLAPITDAANGEAELLALVKT